jgi:hypothetical protein
MRLHRTPLDAHLRVRGRTVWYETAEEMQKARDGYLLRYNAERPHQGRGMNGRTPLQASIDGDRHHAPTPRRLKPTSPRGAATVRSTQKLYKLTTLLTTDA